MGIHVDQNYYYYYYYCCQIRPACGWKIFIACGRRKKKEKEKKKELEEKKKSKKIFDLVFFYVITIRLSTSSSIVEHIFYVCISLECFGYFVLFFSCFMVSVNISLMIWSTIEKRGTRGKKKRIKICIIISNVIKMMLMMMMTIMMI